MTVKNFSSSRLETTRGRPDGLPPPDPQIRVALHKDDYKDTSLFGFCRLRWSLMNQ
jgi:hypothetical protein